MKVHFAGLEDLDKAITLVEVAGVRNGLFTVLPFIGHKFGVYSRSKKYTGLVPSYLCSRMNNIIMDSGLFTLMFGAKAGKRDMGFVSGWTSAIVDFVKETQYTGIVVEVDCQKILGVKAAWKMRRKLRDLLPNNEIINVFHLEDGKRGWDKMIEYGDYVAISVPELRKAGVPNLTDYVVRQAAYARNRKPEIKIHLLGCTSDPVMRACSFCSSCDSTSWLAVNKFGNHKRKMVSGQNQLVNRRTFAKNMRLTKEKVDTVLRKYGVGNTADDFDYYANYALVCMDLLRRYSELAGSQE